MSRFKIGLSFVIMAFVIVAVIPFFRPNSHSVARFVKSISTGESLDKVITQVLDGAKGNYGIVIKNLKTGESFLLNEHQTFPPGSLYKLWVMAEAFDQVETGDLKEDEILSQDVKILNKEFGISNDSAELTEGEITLSASDALKQMIEISHNYAALLLTEKIGLSNVAKFLQEKGFKETSMGIDGSDPASTPYDIALFLEKLYQGKLVSQTYSTRMIDLLKNQQLNGKLPKYLPEDAVIAHKTGEIDYYSHDAGIVYLPSGDYIIVILSKSDYPPGAEDRIAQVSKAVYEYFKD